MNRIKGSLFDNREYLRSLFSTLNNIPVLGREERLGRIEETKRFIRREILTNTRVDPLSDAEGNFVRIGNMLYSGINNKKYYWSQSIKDAIKTGFSHCLKRKEEYYFVNNKFYDKNYCFFIDDKIYDKNEYFLTKDGKPLSRKEYINAFLTDSDPLYVKKKNKEIFEKNLRYYSREWNIHIRIRSSYFSYDFLRQLFILDNGKIAPDLNLYLRWDDAKNLNFDISEEELNILKSNKEKADDIDVRFEFKNCRKKSHKFLKGLMSSDNYPIKEIPNILKIIRETLAL